MYANDGDRVNVEETPSQLLLREICFGHWIPFILALKLILLRRV